MSSARPPGALTTLAHEAPFAIPPENAYNSRRAESQHCVAGWTNEVTHDRSTRVLLDRKRGALIPCPYRFPVLRPFPLIRLYDRLYSAFGPQQWWPAKTPFEVIVGAVLTQNAAWRNVEQALANLRASASLCLGRSTNYPSRNWRN